MSANERQVGGDHYKTGGIELWDLFGPESIIFYATRYLQRWRKKDGVQDLEKALHCVQKMREVAPRHKMRNVLTVDDSLFESWMENAGLGTDEKSIIRRIVIWWKNDVELEYAVASINYLIASERLKTKQADVATGVMGVMLQADLSQLPQNETTADVHIDWTVSSLGDPYAKRDTTGLKYSEMTDEELVVELAALLKKQDEATGWGAAVGVRSGYIEEIHKEQRRRQARQGRILEMNDEELEAERRLLVAELHVGTADARVSGRNIDAIYNEQARRARPSQMDKPVPRGAERLAVAMENLQREEDRIAFAKSLEPTEDLAPWQIDRDTHRRWSEGSAVRHAAMRVFYKQVTTDVYRLEPWVESKVLLSEALACYVASGAHEWLLRIDRVPPSLRECYPSLRAKLNAVEHDQLPAWQRLLYAPRDGGGYYLMNQAWHYDENDDDRFELGSQ